MILVMDRNRRVWATVAVIAGLGMSSAVGRAEDSTTAQEVSENFAYEPEEVSDGDKPDAAQRALLRMREIVTKAYRHLTEARAARDVIRLNCVNEKLTALKGLLRASEQADHMMHRALDQGNDAVANAEFAKISIASQKSEQLIADSEVCVGEIVIYSGETQVEVVDEGQNEERTLPAIIIDDILTRPPTASPYQ